MRRSLACLLLIAAACTQPADEGPRRPEAKAWRMHPPAPTERTEVAAAAADGRIFVIGGFTEQGAPSAVVEIFDIVAERWERGPDLPHAVDHAMAAAVGGRVFLFGGNAAGGASSAAFELVGERWVRLPDMPEPRSAGGAAVLDGKVVVAGGVSREGLATISLLFDPGEKTWSPLPGLAVPREHLGVTAAGGRVFAVGGRRPNNVGDVEWYRFGADAWTRSSDLPTPRGGMAAAGDRRMVFAVGGEDPSKTFNEVEMLSIEGDRWSTLPPISAPRHGLGVVVAGGRLWVLCGGRTPGLSVSGITESIAL